jgi:predicted RecA/RadA family phage recombinase
MANEFKVRKGLIVQGEFLAGEDALPNSTFTLANGATSAINPLAMAVNTVAGQVISSFNAGVDIDIGQLVYLRSNSTWLLADADGSSAEVLLGIALKNVTSGNAVDVLTDGVICVTADYFSTFSVGAPLYVSTTAGRITQTAPSGTGDRVRIVGHYFGENTATTGYAFTFRPDGIWIEL